MTLSINTAGGVQQKGGYGMDTVLLNLEKADTCSAVIVGVFSGKKELPAFLKGIDKQVNGLLSRSLDEKDFVAGISRIRRGLFTSFCFYDIKS